MEVFKYTTTKHYEVIKSAGSLNPRPADGFTYGISEDPLLWKGHLQEVLRHLEKYNGASPIILLKFVIDELDTEAFVQEGDEDVWFKIYTRRPLKDYQRNNFRLPEVVITRSISFEAISIVDSLQLSNKLPVRPTSGRQVNTRITELGTILPHSLVEFDIITEMDEIMKPRNPETSSAIEISPIAGKDVNLVNDTKNAS